MTQNIYDDEAFFAGYSRLERSAEGLEGAAEWPTMRALLPELGGLNVLDLGCGYGWFCRWAREQGATQVLGVDVSAKMLERAAAMTGDPAIAYRRADLETIDLPAGAFELVYSSLAFHYIEKLEALIARIHRALSPGGRLVFSVEHPLFTSPSAPEWVEQADGRKVWPLDGYLKEGPRSTDWLAKGVIKQHRTIGSYVMLLLRAGFTITHLEEWGPSEAQIAARPEWALERDRPLFLLVAARRS
jgi:SAM-dependent methyltransferase